MAWYGGVRVLEYRDMPRATIGGTEEEILVAPKKRAPRKRVSKALASPEGEGVAKPPRPRTRRTVPKSLSAEDVLEQSFEAVARRAPTPLQAEKQHATRSGRLLWVTGLLTLAGCGAAVAIGLSDAGQIDVVAIVNDHNEQVQRGELRDANGAPVTIVVPVQTTDIRPNGGLVPADPATIPPPSSAPVPEAATSTDTEPVTDAAMESVSPAEETSAEPVDVSAAPATL